MKVTDSKKALTDVELVAARAGISETEARSVLYGVQGRCERTAPLKASTIGDAQKREADIGDGEDDAAEFGTTGHAAVFDDPTMLYSWLRETVKRGAFKNALRNTPDCRWLANHQGIPFARTTNGTLRLEERPRGLWHEASFDSRRSDARDLWYAIDRGELTQQSFQFTIERSTLTTCECETWDCDCVWEREIQEVGELYDVGAVTFPAYASTDVGVASTGEESEERNVQASDAEQHESAKDDSSPTTSTGDQAQAIRLRVIAFGGTHHEAEESCATGSAEKH